MQAWSKLYKLTVAEDVTVDLLDVTVGILPHTVALSTDPKYLNPLKDSGLRTSPSGIEK